MPENNDEYALEESETEEEAKKRLVQENKDRYEFRGCGCQG